MTKLWDALDRLEGGKKWGKTHLYNANTGKRCMLGALCNAQADDYMLYSEFDEGELAEDIRVLVDVIRSEHPEFNGCADTNPVDVVWDFNDSRHWREQDFDSVRVVMEKAAVKRDEFLSQL